MATYVLNPRTNDLDVSQQRVRLTTTETEEIASRVKVALLMRRGEWFEDVSLGFPYRVIASVKNNKAFFDSFLQAYLLTIPGVAQVVDYVSTVDSNTRIIDARFSVRTTNNNTINNLAVEV